MQLNQALVKGGHYRFALTISLLLSYTALLFLTLSAEKPQGRIDYRGAVLSHVHIIGSGYGSERSKFMHSHLNKVGYDTVQLNTFVYVRNRDETYLDYKSDPTMSYENIEAEIVNLKKSGFKVMLKPHVWISWWDFDPHYWKDDAEFIDPRKNFAMKDHQKISKSLDPRNSIDFKDPSKR